MGLETAIPLELEISQGARYVESVIDPTSGHKASGLFYSVVLVFLIRFVIER